METDISWYFLHTLCCYSTSVRNRLRGCICSELYFVCVTKTDNATSTTAPTAPTTRHLLVFACLQNTVTAARMELFFFLSFPTCIKCKCVCWRRGTHARTHTHTGIHKRSHTQTHNNTTRAACLWEGRVTNNTKNTNVRRCKSKHFVHFKNVPAGLVRLSLTTSICLIISHKLLPPYRQKSLMATLELKINGTRNF